MVRDLRRDAYRSLLDQSTRFSSERSSGDLMTRLLSDAEQIQTAFGARMADFVQGILTMLLVLLYVFSLNFRLAVAVLVVAPLLVVPIVANFRKLRRTGLSARERIGEMGSLLGETLRGHRLIKTYAMEEFEAGRFGEANRRYFSASRQSMRLQALNSPLMEILAGIGLSVVFIYAAGQIRAGQMTVGGLLSFLAAIMMMYKPLKDVTRTNIVLQVALASADRIFEVVDAANEIVEKPEAQRLAPFSTAIAYEGVSFGYGAEPVLKNVDIVIRRGETVALVGPSGAGKTTLVNLLPRLYDPTGGRVTFDGVDLRDASLDSLRRQIGLVTQETILFDTSVRANIAYGDPAPPEERVRAAARAACADEFIEHLPQGYDNRRRRSRLAALGRAAAAAGDRAGDLQGCPDPHPRRGDVAARHRVRVADREGARQPDAGANDARHRAPALDGSPRRPHPRSRRRAHRRGGQPRLALDSARPLSQAPRHAVLRRERDGRARAGRPMTLRSMTGFGRARGPVGRDWTAEIVARSVNGRFLDLTVKTRESEVALEPAVRRVFGRELHRGKVDVAVRLKRNTSSGAEIRVDEGLLEGLLSRMAELSQKYPIEGRLAARDLLAVPQIVTIETPEDAFLAEEVAAVEALARSAARSLVAMRESEGAAISADLSPRVALLRAKAAVLGSRREEIARNLAATLRERVRTLFPDAPIDPGRLEQEVALAADRADVAEELQRLGGHLDQFDGLLAKPPEAVGKTLDFLTQEILRELNTLGSKSRDLASTREILEMKAEVEKIREQVQNVE